jgi:hypothetical protein
MSAPPAAPKIYHITHVENFRRMVPGGLIYCEARMIAGNHANTAIGMSSIKARRLNEIEVGCHPGTKVGDYVPFYFCPRSVMLFLIYKRNHPELAYKGGQEPILHLEADLNKVVDWADRNSRKWAFTKSNAGTRYTEFFADLRDIGRIDWEAVAATDFRDPEVKDGKQAEFLIHDSFPMALVDRVVAKNEAVARQAAAALETRRLEMPVTVEPRWYY